MMPGGSPEAYSAIKDIVEKVAAQVDDGPCVMYIGDGGAGNFVKMVHNGIEYGDMQLISEAYDILKTVGGMTNPELAAAFAEWNKVRFLASVPSAGSQYLGRGKSQLLQKRPRLFGGEDFLYLVQTELNSFLVEITSEILAKEDDKGDGYLVEKILDKTGMKGTGAHLCHTSWAHEFGCQAEMHGSFTTTVEHLSGTSVLCG